MVVRLVVVVSPLGETVRSSWVALITEPSGAKVCALELAFVPSMPFEYDWLLSVLVPLLSVLFSNLLEV